MGGNPMQISLEDFFQTAIALRNKYDANKDDPAKDYKIAAIALMVQEVVWLGKVPTSFELKFPVVSNSQWVKTPILNLYKDFGVELKIVQEKKFSSTCGSNCIICFAIK